MRPFLSALRHSVCDTIKNQKLSTKMQGKQQKKIPNEKETRKIQLNLARIECPKCNSTFSRSDNLLRHMATRHNDNPCIHICVCTHSRAATVFVAPISIYSSIFEMSRYHVALCYFYLKLIYYYTYCCAPHDKSLLLLNKIEIILGRRKTPIFTSSWKKNISCCTVMADASKQTTHSHRLIELNADVFFISK